MINKKNFAEISEEILAELEATTELTALAPGSSAAVLANIIARRIAELYGDMEFNNAMAFPSTARGVYLDLKAEEFGLKRIEAQPAISYASDQNIKFYAPTGVLKTYLPLGYIPASTRITNTGGDIVYKVANDTYFADADNEVFVTASASSSGTENNVAKGELEVHSLGPAQVSVSNMYAIQNGEDVESNESLRSRMSAAPLVLATGNLDAIRASVSVIPGSSEVMVIPYEQGVGSIGIKIIPVANVLTDDLSAQVAILAGANKAAGDYLHVTGPEYCPVELSVQLLFDIGVTEAEKAALVSPCESAILGYLSSLRMGQMFVLNEMIQRIMDTSETILDMQVRCYSFRGRPQALRNFVPYKDEVYIADPDISKPIEVFV